MLVYQFATHYPSLYKPYYDSQFVDLMKRGHDLRIFSVGNQGTELSRKVKRHGLAERTTRLCPDSLRDSALFLPPAIGNTVRQPQRALELYQIASDGERKFKEALKHLVRAQALPLEPPDLCIVHSHETMRLVPWIGDIYPDARVAMYYYGGVPTEAATLSPETVAMAFHEPDVVFTCSEFSKSEAVGKGCDASKIRVLPLAFDLADFSWPEERSYRPAGTLRVISVGRLSLGKGHHLALRALNRVSRKLESLRFQYDIVGHGPRRSELEQLVSELDLEDRVNFRGGRPSEEVIQLLGRSDVMLLPSFSTPQWTETQGTVIQEAMLMGAIPVTTRTGGVPESIPNMMRQFQVEEGSVDALVEGLTSVAALSQSELQRLGREGREWVSRHFRIEDFNDQLLTVMTNLQSGDGASNSSKRR